VANKVPANPDRSDDTTIASAGILVRMDANVMIEALRNVSDEEHRNRVAAAARAWAGER
jgi:hypothetical protein